VVCKNGGSSLLRDCPLLERVARAVVRAAAPCPVTAKIRIGWDRTSINAVTTARLLEDAGVQAIAVHGRTRSQGYSGEADWDVIGQVVRAVTIPVIGNGDLTSAESVRLRRDQTGVAGAMLGRGAMSAPWIFREIHEYLGAGSIPGPIPLAGHWAFIQRHCALSVARSGEEAHTMAAMRARLMAYSRGMPAAKQLREQFSTVSTLAGLAAIASSHLSAHAATEMVL
jgi:nifR3 family TIM-barrel protein